MFSSHLLSRNIKIKIHEAMILLVVLCGCETLSLTVRDKHKLGIFENGVLRRPFGPKRYQITGG
jgi:hypothetical protein